MCTSMFRDRRSVNPHPQRSLSLLRLVVGSVLLAAFAPIAHAHVSEGGLVLLLPTGFYIWAGGWAVALTVAALLFIPAHWGEVAFQGRALAPAPALRGSDLFSLLSTLCVWALIIAGIAGSRDPLLNPLPLTIWTLLWMALLILQGALGDIWRGLNPWSGLHRLIAGNGPPPFSLPDRLGCWPAVIGLLLFACFAFADPAPDDPARLALAVLGYWLATLAGMLLFGGEAWLSRCEFLTLLMRLFADIAPIGRQGGRFAIGAPGWRLFQRGSVAPSMGVFALVSLGVGSFDGLNETFWWLGFIGVNPLEFPGRTAIFYETVGGLLAANLLLVTLFAATVWAGLRLARLAPGTDAPFHELFAMLALAVTPISLGYHLAHYLTSLLVNLQYALLSASDPLGTGADYLGLGVFYVSTGFFNRLETVELIFTTQTVAIVLGHILSVMLAHAMAIRAFSDWRRAALSQLPLAAFMVGYTFLGLWLLASPKGA